MDTGTGPPQAQPCRGLTRAWRGMIGSRRGTTGLERRVVGDGLPQRNLLNDMPLFLALWISPPLLRGDIPLGPDRVERDRDLPRHSSSREGG